MESLHLLQARYWDSLLSFESARLIVQRKCWNMAHILRRGLAYRSKMYPAQASILHRAISSIQRASESVERLKDRTALLLTEGRATKAYWSGFALMSHCPPDWRRDYPHAQDPWNQSLNIGYTILANMIRERLVAHGLTSAIGMLHAPQQAHEALIYDFQELFRQPVVDAALMPIFSRNRTMYLQSKQIVSLVLHALDDDVAYEEKRWRLWNVLDQETVSYARALERHSLFEPYRHSWSHGNKNTPRRDV